MRKIKIANTRVMEGAIIYKCIIQFVEKGHPKFITATAAERLSTADVLKGYDYKLPIFRTDFVYIGKDRIEVSAN